MNKKDIPQLRIDIRAKTDETAEIDIYGEIGWYNEKGELNSPLSIKEKLRDIANLDVDKIVVNINSLGGFVDDGLAIHDVLAAHPAEIETRVIGMTASAATVIAQAGSKRTMSENALYLIHHAWGLVIGNAMDMLSAAQDMEMGDSRMVNIYVKRSGKSEEEIRELMSANGGHGKWISAEEAMEYGLIDQVFEPMKIAAAVPRTFFSTMGMPQPTLDQFEKLQPEPTKESKETHSETINGLRLRLIQNRKAKNKII